MAFSFIAELEFSPPPSGLSILLLYLVPLFSQEVAGLAPALPLTSQVTMHAHVLISGPLCPYRRKRAQVGGGEPETHLVLILNLSAHHPTSEVFIVRGVSWMGHPRTTKIGRGGAWFGPCPTG